MREWMWLSSDLLITLVNLRRENGDLREIYSTARPKTHSEWKKSVSYTTISSKNDGMGNETKKRPTTYDIDVRKIVLRWQMR